MQHLKAISPKAKSIHKVSRICLPYFKLPISVAIFTKKMKQMTCRRGVIRFNNAT